MKNASAKASIRRKLSSVLPYRTHVPGSFYKSIKVQKVAKKPTHKIIRMFGGLSMKPSIPKRDKEFLNRLYLRYRVSPERNVFNASKNSFVTNRRMVGKLIKKGISSGRVRNMIDPKHGIGGINPEYISYAARPNVNPRAVAIARGKKLKAFALFNNRGHINVLSAAPTYGGTLLKKIVNSEPNRQFNLNAVPNAKLVAFYQKHGFAQYANANSNNGLVPMRRAAKR